MFQSENILEISSLTKAFGGLVAIFDLDFTVSRGIIKAIIGPNGAGKTTLFNLISGVLSSDTGDIIFNGQPVTKYKPHQLAERGISRTFQTVELFSEMTVLQNVMIGRHIRTRKGVLSVGLKLPASRREERAIFEKARYYLDFVGLEEKADQEAGNLPLGQQKLLEIARALATEPKLLLLDEPAAGLNETETEMAAQLFKVIRDEGITIILVEHDMNLVMNVAEEVLVLDYGRKIADDKPEVVRSDPEVINAYLGVDIEYA
ncbi:MAG: ABC transporter ATP-binding protein [Deltaproteobacteria bacterium]|nr:ABC transporter ATP-binding protein [Deltaproteobacteria bacterium]MBW2322511.1 ABC transporter ATP-binding protein [Deltaproteobacteria bacterium]